MGPKPAQKENGKKRELLANSAPLRTFAPASTQMIVVAKQPAGNQAAVQSQNVGLAAFTSNSQEKSSLSTQGSPRMRATENAETSTVRQFQLSREKATGMSRDVTAIVREIQETFPNYTLILSLISKWSGNDRELSTAMGTPHLDALFKSLENQRINIGSWRTAYLELESKALDRLIHLFDNRTVTHDLFHSFIKDSNAYRDYVAGPNITALWQWEMMLADELREEIERGNYDIVQKKLDQVTITDRDDVSVSLVANMTEKDILSITKSEPGNALLTRLYDELSAGNYEENERLQANRIFSAKTAAFAASKSDPEKDFFKADIKIFPHRKTGLTVGLFSAPAAQFTVWRSRPGYIWVQLNHGVYSSAAYRKEVESFGYATFWEKGLELREDELIKVKQYDKGGKEEYWPAFKLLEISNEDTTHTFQKIGEVSSLPLLLFMAGPSAVAKSGWAAASWGARAARILQIADYATTGAGILTTVLLEHRGWFIKEWGEPGQDIVDTIERVNSAVLLYGFIRLATQMPNVVRNLNKAAQEWRKAVRDRKDLLQSLEKPKRDAITNLDEGLYRYEKSIRDVIAANDNLELPVNTGVSTKTGPSAKSGRTNNELPTHPNSRARMREKGSEDVHPVPRWDRDKPTPPGAGGQPVKATGTDDIAPDVPPTAVRPGGRPPFKVINFPEESTPVASAGGQRGSKGPEPIPMPPKEAVPVLSAEKRPDPNFTARVSEMPAPTGESSAGGKSYLMPSPVLKKPEPVGLQKTPLSVEEGSEILSEAKILANKPKVFVAVRAKITGVNERPISDGLKGASFTELEKFDKNRSAILGNNGRAAVLPEVNNPPGSPAKIGSNQRSSGFVIERGSNGNELQVSTWNTGDPVIESNVSHAEQQFLNWFELQNHPWKARIRKIELSVAGLEICPKCETNINALVQELKLKYPDIEIVIKALPGE